VVGSAAVSAAAASVASVLGSSLIVFFATVFSESGVYGGWKYIYIKAGNL
jgi:hypothetical protein